MPPGEYRTRGYHTVYDVPKSERDANMFDVQVKQIDKIKLAGLPHQGSYMEVGSKFEQAVGLGMANGLIDGVPQMIGIYYSDPGSVDEKDLQSFAGFVLAVGKEAPQPLEVREIEAGAFAVLTHKGPYGELFKAYQWLYGQWLVDSGKEVADAPPFEKYLNSPHDTAPADLLTEICVPIKS